MTKASRTDKEMLNDLLRTSFDYFRVEFNAANGLILDRTAPGSPCSIAAVGMGLTSYVSAAERGLLSRKEATGRILPLLKFLEDSPQGPEPDTAGYRGFYYHFLDMETGRRAIGSELSTVDTAILLAGALTAANYFTEVREIADRAETLYRRVDWQWARNGGVTLSHGWKPESGFLPFRWDTGYSEAIILYAMALGSPTYPIDPAGYHEWTATFERKQLYDIEYLYAGPLFIHQMSHLWLDFRGIQDGFNRQTGVDYFENSRRATQVQRRYAIDNPSGYAHYHQYGWGFTASDGPGPCIREVNGVRRVFYDYEARGAPFGPDDGTIAPWAVAASLPFAPDLVIDTVRHAIERLELKGYGPYGFDASFNPTYPESSRNRHGWVSPWIFGLNQGPIIIMIENFQTELIWKTVRKCQPFVTGLRRAGFEGGWLA